MSEVTTNEVTTEVQAQATAPDTTTQADAAATSTTTVETLRAKAKELSGATATAEQKTGDTTAAPIQPYTPSYKYKVYDQEKEFNKIFHPLIKDHETEKLVRELYEKADGLDTVKPRFQKVREEYQTLKAEHTGMQEAIQELGQYIRQGDLDTFFEKIELNPTKVFKWVLDKINYQQLPPEQRAALDSQKEASRQAQMYQAQNQTLQQNYEQALAQARQLELDTALFQPEVRSLADAFDARLGKPGAFKEQVVNAGKLAYYSTGKDISVAEALEQVKAMAGNLVGQTGTQAPQVQMTGTPTQTPQAPKSPPVIPNVSGKGNSPAKKVIKSIAELRELGSQMQ